MKFVALADTLDGMKFLENVPLAPYTTLKIGGPAKWFAEAVSEADILEAVAFAQGRGLPLFALGGGSNLLVADAGYEGLVLRIALRGTTEFFEGDKVVFRVAAGEDWDEFVAKTVSQDCAGVECLAGIPGTVGGTPVQNVGAYGQEVSDTVSKVRVFDLQSGNFLEKEGKDCGFAYRQSLFNTTARGRFLVTRVHYALTPGGVPTLHYADLKRYFEGRTGTPRLAEVAKAVREIRRQKGMFLVEGDPDCASAGSFFKNPVVDQTILTEIEASVHGVPVPMYPTPEGKVKLVAAWLLEQAGFAKGFSYGRVGISSRHTLALVNRGGATAADILELSGRIMATVEEKFGVKLEREPVFLG